MRNPFAFGRNRRTDRFIALARQNKKIEVFEMIRAGQDINARDWWGDTALCSAIDYKRADLATDLLAAKADPNLPGERNRTPMEYAVQKCKDVIPALIEAGARPVIGNGDSKPSLLIFWAIAYRDRKVLEALIQHRHHLNLPAGEKVTPLEAAVTSGADDMAMLLLDAGVRPEGIDLVTGKPLVFSLIREERLDLLLKMIEKGADMTVRDPEGKSADDLFRHVVEARRLAGEARKREQEEQDRQREERIAAARLAEEQEKERRTKEAEKMKKSAWTKTSDDDVLHARFHPGLGRELRDIFNFRTRERITAVVDPKTGRTEALAITHFQQIDPGVLEEALDAFRQQGGAADRSALRGPVVQRDKRPLLGGGG